MNHRVMAFVDGSNVMIEMASIMEITHPADKPSDMFLSLACQVVHKALADYQAQEILKNHRLIRKYWFGSVQGDEDDLSSRSEVLRNNGYDAQLFKKVKGRNEKGVDLAVAREMLVHGFHKNYDIAVIVAGDSDYIGLVQDVKRLGHIVVGCFYQGKALSSKLKLATDYFIELPNPIAVNPTICEILRSGG